MSDSLRDRIMAVISHAHSELKPRHYLGQEVLRCYADAVIEALPELNPDHVRAKYLKDWEEGYDDGYSAGGGGC